MKEEQLITSRRAGIIDLALSLREKKGRAEHNLCFAEGAVAADYALKIKSAVKCVLLSREATEKCAALAKQAAAGDVPFYLLTKECFEKISVLKNPEGLALLVEPAKLLSKPEELPACQKQRVAPSSALHKSQRRSRSRREFPLP